jgi:hypothetical protein
LWYGSRVERTSSILATGMGGSFTTLLHPVFAKVTRIMRIVCTVRADVLLVYN